MIFLNKSTVKRHDHKVHSSKVDFLGNGTFLFSGLGNSIVSIIIIICPSGSWFINFIQSKQKDWGHPVCVPL